MPPKKRPENVLPPAVEALKRLRHTPQKPKPRKLLLPSSAKSFDLTPEELAAKREERAAKERQYKKNFRIKAASNPDGTRIPVKERGMKNGKRKRGSAASVGRPFKKGKDWDGNRNGPRPQTGEMSLPWFRNYMSQPINEILAKPREGMSAMEATVVEALRLAIDRSGEEAVVSAIQNIEFRAGCKRDNEDGLPSQLSRTLSNIMDGNGGTIARLLSTPDDRLKAIKHLHGYQLGASPQSINLQNNGGSFESPPTGEPEEIEVVLVTPEGRQKLQRLDKMPAHEGQADTSAESGDGDASSSD